MLVWGGRWKIGDGSELGRLGSPAERDPPGLGFRLFVLPGGVLDDRMAQEMGRGRRQDAGRTSDDKGMADEGWPRRDRPENHRLALMLYT